MNLQEQIKLAYLTARLLRSQWWPREKILEYQKQRLRQILRYASTHTRHYREFAPAESTSSPFAWLQQFPILTKPCVQAGQGRLLSNEMSDDELHQSQTSGSTGEPTKTWFDKHCWMIVKHGLKARRIINCVRRPGLRLLALSEDSSNSSMPLTKLPLKKRFVDIEHIPLETPAEVAVAKMARYQPNMLQGYPSILEYISDTAEETGLTLPKVSHVFTSSELLTNSTRRKLEEAFCAKVVDVYGSTEFKEIAVQCRAGRYHVNFESVYVEAVADPTTQRKRLLITSLLNRAMPLIRYDIGDFGDIGTGRCECGRDGPYVTTLDGRHGEILRFPGGAVLSGYVLTMAIENYEEIRSFCIIHRQPIDVEIHVYAQPEMSVERRRTLYVSIQDLLPVGVSLSIKMLDERPPVGKRIAVRNETHRSHI